MSSTESVDRPPRVEQTSPGGVAPSGSSPSGASRRGPSKVGFPAAVLSIVVLVGAGTLGLDALSEHWAVYRSLRETLGTGAALAALPGRVLETSWSHGTNIVRDLAYLCFLVSFAVFAWLRRDEFAQFFRSMRVGVSVVGLSTLAVAVGVVVPQIDPPDDATARVAPAGVPGSNYEEHFESFQWAVSYFLYHLQHLYGVGMPKAEIPEQALAGLDEFGRRYGFEEQENRRKGMEAAFSGQVKTDAIYAFATHNESALRRAFDICTALQFNRVYRSHWFASLMCVLALAIAANTFHGGPKRWFTTAKFGFFLVHVGMLVMLAGGGLSRVFTMRGILHLHTDGLDRNRDGVFAREMGEIPPVEDAFFRSYLSGLENLRFLPFGLSLQHFARRDWPAVRVIFLDADGVPIEFKSRLPAYTLWNGRSIDLDYVEDESGTLQPRLRLVAKQLHERARADAVASRERTPAERGDSAARPAARIQIPDFRALMERGEPTPGEQWPKRTEFMWAATPAMDGVQCLTDPLGKFRLVVARGGDPLARFPATEGLLGRVYVRAMVGDREVDEVVPVRLGEFTELPGGFRVVFQRATKDYQVDPRTGAEVPVARPLAEQYPVRPAVFAHIVAADGTAEDRVLEHGADPLARGLTAGYTFEDLILELEWDDWTSPGPPRHVLFYGDGGPARLVPQSGAPREIVFGEALPFEGGIPVVVEALFDDLVAEPQIDFLPPTERQDRWDEDFYSTDPRGLELEVVTWPLDEARRTSTTVRLATSADRGANLYLPDDRSFVLEFFENDAGFPFEWRSVLRVHERDANGAWQELPIGNERSREIRVNDYLHHAGYRMFQSNAIAGDPEYSGIGIVFDPGIPLAMAGMWIVIAGAAWAFLVRPIVLARGKRVARAA
jgi:hypothetical protein